MQLFEPGILIMVKRRHRIGKFRCDLNDMMTILTLNGVNETNLLSIGTFTNLETE